MQQAMAAFHTDDAATLRSLLEAHPDLRAFLNRTGQSFGTAPIHHVRSVAMLDVLADFGADLNALSEWGPGGFHILETLPPDLAAHAISRGAALTVHAAARLNRLPDLQRLVAADPQLVHARGGDGKLPLHYASTPEIAQFLLDHGAEIDARDIDHSSTAAQYLVKDHPDVARYLISRGCQTDILMAAALGDRALVDAILAKDPEAIRTRVSDEWFPLVGSPNGGSIYQWQFGWHVSAVQVALKYGHQELADYILARCPPDEHFLNLCWLHREVACNVPQHNFTVAARRHLAHAARNNDTVAARLLLAAGFPLDARSQHNATALHWAAFHGNAELTALLLKHHADQTDTANDFNGDPLNWAQHGAKNGWYRDSGDYPATLALLEGVRDITQ